MTASYGAATRERQLLRSEAAGRVSRVMKLPRIIGHRGAKTNAPENTLAGIRRAHEEGATWIEFDVKLTKDRVAVLIHDETLDRTTTGRGAVRELPLEAIRRVDAGCPKVFGETFKGERVPTLVEALELMAALSMGFNLEIKPCPGRERETAIVAVDVVRKHWPRGAPTPILSSFKLASLEAAAEAAPALPRGYLAEQLGPSWREEARRLACTTIHPGHRGLTRAQVQQAQAGRYPLLVWTVNDPARARELVAWGVDSLITDSPAAIAAAIA
jgi:glycerophosphoryl diester phosphodiesterase